MNFKKILVIFLTLSGMLQSISMNARHIVGGDVKYICLGIDSSNASRWLVEYEFTMNMYRDCFQGGGQLSPYDNSATVGIHRLGASGWRHLGTLNPAISESGVRIPIADDPCVDIPPNICVDRGTYIFTLRLEVTNEPYLISFQRCCRNNTISNIQNPESSGAVIYVEISPESQRVCNDSPSFNDFPPVLICAGSNFEFDHSATDTDGDQLVYSFCTPLQAGGRDENNPTSCNGTTPNPQNCLPPFSEVQFQLPTFSATRPVIGDPDLTIDPNTGVITGMPTLTGQFVVGICVEEYRDGELLGSINRDFQFNVTTCDPLVEAGIQADAQIADREFLLNSCGENTITFLNESVDEQFIQSYKWEFGIGDNTEIFSTRDATVTFPGIGEYNGVMTINEGTDCADTATIFVNIYPDLETDFTFDYDTCIAGAVDYLEMSTPAMDNIVTGWNWDFAGQGDSNMRNPSFEFDDPGLLDVTLTVTDNNECTATSIQTVDWRPAPQLIVIEPSSFLGCSPSSIFFNNLSTPIDETYDITWDFGDGEIGKEISPTHIYTEEGTYSVDVDIISPIGCSTSRSFPNLIRIETKPKADFSFTPEVVNIFNNTIEFFDQSIDAISWKWNFDDEGIAFDPNPSYTFQDTGIHFAELVVVHPNRCTDTLRQFIDVEPVANFFMPNAFTPNGDFENDTFQGKGYISVFQDFNMTIWNRWGEKVFETDNPSEGWNGRKNNSGLELPSGVYVYQVSYLGPRGGTEELKGFATLVR